MYPQPSTNIQPSLNYPVNTPDRVDFDKDNFDTLVGQKGRSVKLERSLLCPCKGVSSNQQSSCKNCGGSGYIYYNPITTKMVIQGMDKSVDWKPWSEESAGVINITSFEEDQIAVFDKVTVLEANSIFSEALNFKYSSALSQYFSYTTYPIKKMLYSGLFIDVNTVLTRLTEGTDFSYNGDRILLNNSYYNPTSLPKTITVKYVHAPVYLIMVMKRDSMESYDYETGDKLIRLPVSAMAKRLAYNIVKENLSGDRLLNNSFIDTCTSYTPQDSEYVNYPQGT